MPYLYDTLIRFGLKPGKEFEFNQKANHLMRVKGPGVRKLIEQHYLIKLRKIHLSLLPDDNGVVNTALVSVADQKNPPGVWHVILDRTGKPVAEHPLTYSKRKFEPTEPDDVTTTPTASQAVAPGTLIVHTTADLARMLISWLVCYDRINDDEIAKILKILSVHVLSPREISITLENRNMAQRMHDELLCFEDDVNGIPDAVAQASKLREEVALLLKTDTL